MTSQTSKSLGLSRYKQSRCVYKRQRSHALYRGIPWKLTYIQWRTIWARSGHWCERGNKRSNMFVMARYGDIGAYEDGNVKIITSAENIREAQLGNKNCVGRKYSNETLAKMSRSHKGTKPSAEARAKMSRAQKGKKMSTEAKLKISRSKLGNKVWLGKKHSEETKAKMSATRKAIWEDPNYRQSISEGAKKGWIKRKERYVEKTQ